MASDANKYQVGGAHYKNDYEHWDLMLDNGLGVDYLVGQATKYVSRWRKKNGLQDLQKALHFTNKLLENSHRVIFRHWEVRSNGEYIVNKIKEGIDRYAVANRLNEQEADFCELMVLLDTRSSLEKARDILLSIMDQYYLEHPDEAPKPVPLEDSNKHAERA